MWEAGVRRREAWRGLVLLHDSPLACAHPWEPKGLALQAATRRGQEAEGRRQEVSYLSSHHAHKLARLS